MEQITASSQPLWVPYLIRLAQLIPQPLLNGAGLVALADLPSLLFGSASDSRVNLYDFLVFGPGIYRQNDVARLNHGEYPACAAMTSGYVFRIENEAMIHYMQTKAGRTGELTTLTVQSDVKAPYPLSSGSKRAFYLRSAVMSLSLLTLAMISSLNDWTAIAAWWIYFVARFVNNLVMANRQSSDWKGKKEPNVNSDLLILLSNDRWIRLRGLTDHVKLVTSGAWLRPSTGVEKLWLTLATILIFLNAGVVGGATDAGKMLILLYMIASTFLMEIANNASDQLIMFGSIVGIEKRKAYERRLDMAHDLVDEVGRDDWCEKMGIILNRQQSTGKSTGHVMM